MSICPVCRSTLLIPQVSRSELRREILIRDRFVRRRVPANPSRMELTDLSEFMHGGLGELAACSTCGTAVRIEDPPVGYENDPYDPDLLEVLYPRYLHAFRAREQQYRPLLRGRAEILEVGSHVGSFLQVAEEWGWRPRGFDVGRSTSEFAKRKGLFVQRSTLEGAHIFASSADAIFIWNCFEQLGDPVRTLQECYTLLGHHGLLVVRVPNMQFYRNTRRGAGRSSTPSLAYNNLLGFPYLTGYEPLQLSALLESNGFAAPFGFNSSLLTVPYPEPSSRVRREIDRIQSRFVEENPQRPESLHGPWIEMVVRKVD